MASKPLSVFRISSGIRCGLGSGSSHSGGYQVSGNQTGVGIPEDSGFLRLAALADTMILCGSHVKVLVCRGKRSHIARKLEAV